MRVAPPPLLRSEFERRWKELYAKHGRHPHFMEIDTALRDWHESAQRANRFGIIAFVVAFVAFLIVVIVTAIKN